MYNLDVVYRFCDSQNQDRYFTGPFDHFMCAYSTPGRGTSRRGEDLAGLFFALPDSVTRNNPQFAIFGVVSLFYSSFRHLSQVCFKNFFQTMFVAMHLPRQGHGVPYVQVAPQWQTQRSRSKLPPLVPE